MTKTEITELGRQEGAASAALILKTGFFELPKTERYDGDDLTELHRISREYATNRIHHRTQVGQRHIHQNVYILAFVGAFERVIMDAHGEQPEVKAAARLRRMQRHMSTVIETAQAVVGKFAADFEKAPARSFEWADGAMHAAARLEIYSRLAEMLKGGDGTQTPIERLDVVVRAARTEALRYARFGNHSTSAAANIMAEYRAAAFAEFCEYDDRW